MDYAKHISGLRAFITANLKDMPDIKYGRWFNGAVESLRLAKRAEAQPEMELHFLKIAQGNLASIIDGLQGTASVRSIMETSEAVRERIDMLDPPKPNRTPPPLP